MTAESAWPATQPSLLVRVRDTRDDESLGEFYRIYSVPVYRQYLRWGAQHADADELTNEGLRRAAAAIQRGQYNPGKAKFRSYLWKIIYNLYSRFREKKRPDAPLGTLGINDPLDQMAAPPETPEWADDYDMRLCDCALEQIRPHFKDRSVEAFERVVLKKHDRHVVAGELGLSADAINMAISRVTKRFIEKLRELSDDDFRHLC